MSLYDNLGDLGAALARAEEIRRELEQEDNTPSEDD